MNWKIQRDSFYQELFNEYGQQFIDNAGYFEDECKYNFDIKESLSIPCTPLDYIRQNLHKENPAIIISTGSFNPIHDGHIEMMIRAKETIEKNGYSCIGGFIAPDHDAYMKLKLGDAALDIHKRIKLISEAIEELDWLNIDPWAGIFHVTSINFTDIIQRLKLYIKENLGVEIPIFFVCGGDNVRFANTFALKGHCVVINRPGYAHQYLGLFPNVKNILFGMGNNSNSSTKVRETFEYPNGKTTAYIRCDGASTNQSIDKILGLIDKEFDQTKFINISQQKSVFNKFLHSEPSISLDPFIESDFNLGVSRLFDCFGLKKLGYTSRPNTTSWMSEIQNMGDIKKIDLFDDDIDSGGTMDFVENYLKEFNIKVGRRISFSKTNGTREVIDLRDFIYKSFQGGLVVKDPKGNAVRVPYIYPFVCPYNRASIQNPMEFSKLIWEANIEYYGYKREYGIAEECRMYLKMLDLF